MAIITQRGTVDLIPEYNRALRPIFCVSEGDANSRVINLSVTSGGEAFTIPSGAMVYVAGKKQDNNIFVYRCSFTSNTVVFPITDQMSALDGIVMCELQIIVNGNPLGTANFVYWVEPSPIQNGTTSESDLNLFEEAIAKFENFDHFYADVEAMVTEAVANMQIREGQTVIDASLSVSGAAADAKATGDIVRAFMDALVTESTAEAAIATCDDAAGGLPLKKLTANIEPTQSGTGDPSPDNVRPISGYTGVTVTRTGKNLHDGSPVAFDNGSTIKNGITLTKNSDGTFKLSGTATAETRVILTTPVQFKNGTTYTISVKGFSGISANTARIIIQGVPSSMGLNYMSVYPVDDWTHTFTCNADVHFQYFFFDVQNGKTINNTISVQIEVGNTATEYEPYNGATYPITFPTEAGTVYGGTLTLNSDGSGALTVTKVGATLDSSMGWTYYRSDGSTEYNGFSANVTRVFSSPVKTAWGATKYTAICNAYVCDDGLAYRHTGNAFAITSTIVAVSTNQAQTVAEFNDYITANPVTIVATLATPTTYALSAVQVATMLNGVNNIWTNTAGTLTTEYYASTGLYVEKRVNAQRNMIAGVEEAMTATKNYSVDDLLIVGNTLYKVTAAISSGAALVVGTNVTETTVAEQLLALA